MWLSTSQLVNLSPTENSPANTTATRCTIRLNDTALRHAPGNNWISAYRLPRAGARFYLSGDAVVTSGGFRWRLGRISSSDASLATDTRGSNWNNRMVWVADIQLTLNDSCQ